MKKTAKIIVGFVIITLMCIPMVLLTMFEIALTLSYILGNPTFSCGERELLLMFMPVLAFSWYSWCQPSNVKKIRHFLYGENHREVEHS